MSGLSGLRLHLGSNNSDVSGLSGLRLHMASNNSDMSAPGPRATDGATDGATERAADRSVHRPGGWPNDAEETDFALSAVEIADDSDHRPFAKLRVGGLAPSPGSARLP